MRMSRRALKLARSRELIAGLGLVAVLLLASTTVLLAMLASRDGASTSSPAAVRGEPAAAQPPPLPESSRGPTTRALASEMDRITKRLGAPLDDVLGELIQTRRQISVLAGLPPSVRGLVENTRALSENTRTIPQLAGLPPNLAMLVQQTSGIRDMREALFAMLGETRQLRGIRASLGDLNVLLGDFRGTVDGTNQSLQSIDATLQQTNRELAALRACLRRPVICEE
jgi:hypothetical protein